MLPEEFYKKNMEMWEQFTTTYMDTMFKTWEQAMDQSKSFRDQVDKAVADTISGQMDMTLSMLKSMQGQMETLSSKMDQLLEKEDK